jgi:predicted metalloprotease with PDZ domain
MARPRTLAAALVVLLSAAAESAAQAPIAYRLSFPEREHRLMEVEVTFTDLPAGTLQLRMSRSSPGRYALHEFAKNVFDVRITDGQGHALSFTRPNLHQWDVSGHGGTVQVAYRIYGDRVDGTYLAVDSTHAHINMPAALMWARGLGGRPATVRFETPPGTSWRVATQLLPGRDTNTFVAPNLQYLMDSPSEVSAFALRTFTVNDAARVPVFRIAVHHAGTDEEIDSLARGIEAIVREARHVFGEYPAFEGNTYTFIADYLPWANGDGMEHRNSTILTSSSSIRANRSDLLDTAAHEFFHAWNVERIRPASLEPFDFEEANVSGELWLAEGFTNYYAPLLLKRTDLTSVRDFAREMGRALNTVLASPGRRIRSVVEMSQFAPFVDAATSTDRTNFDNTFISYYTWGQAIGLGLDLTLRSRSDGRVSLDTFMRALWDRHGRAGGPVTGAVEHPYTLADVKHVLGEVAGDPAWAGDFFARYIEGRDMVDYAPLLARAGLLWRPLAPGRPFAGELRIQDGTAGARVTAAVPFATPAYEAGLDRDDLIVSIAGTNVSSGGDVARVIASRKPGEEVAVVFERRGQRVTSTMKLAEDPRRELVPAEDAGQTLTDAQKRFRDGWLSSAARNTF